MIRNLTLSGRRKLPRQNRYVEITPEEIELRETLERLGITREQMVDIAILVGTDFNPGVKGIGAKKGLKLIKEYGSLERLVEAKGIDPGCDWRRVREIFLDPDVEASYDLEWSPPDVDGVIDFLCGERAFSRTRVEGALAKMNAIFEKKKQQSLDRWF